MGLWAGVQAALAFFPWAKLATAMSVLSKLGGSVFTVNPTAGIAWDAHLGALCMGLILFFAFPRKKKRG
jgi:membrane associated rhomboid family serine protease